MKYSAGPICSYIWQVKKPDVKQCFLKFFFSFFFCQLANRAIHHLKCLCNTLGLLIDRVWRSLDLKLIVLSAYVECFLAMDYTSFYTIACKYTISHVKWTIQFITKFYFQQQYPCRLILTFSRSNGKENCIICLWIEFLLIR